jgi:hypothetical protein
MILLESVGLCLPEHRADLERFRPVESLDPDLLSDQFSGVLGKRQAVELCLYVGQCGQPNERFGTELTQRGLRIRQRLSPEVGSDVSTAGMPLKQ